jgi:hypothetical protein
MLLKRGTTAANRTTGRARQARSLLDVLLITTDKKGWPSEATALEIVVAFPPKRDGPAFAE